jgi:hypothetical protein
VAAHGSTIADNKITYKWYIEMYCVGYFAEGPLRKANLAAA